MELQTRHNDDCQRVFRNYDPRCPRCAELASGAQPRAGWGARKHREEANALTAIKNHNCNRSNCGPVCTFGDW